MSKVPETLEAKPLPEGIKPHELLYTQPFLSPPGLKTYKHNWVRLDGATRVTENGRKMLEVRFRCTKCKTYMTVPRQSREGCLVKA